MTILSCFMSFWSCYESCLVFKWRKADGSGTIGLRFSRACLCEGLEHVISLSKFKIFPWNSWAGCTLSSNFLTPTNQIIFGKRFSYKYGGSVNFSDFGVLIFGWRCSIKLGVCHKFESYYDSSLILVSGEGWRDELVCPSKFEVGIKENIPFQFM